MLGSRRHRFKQSAVGYGDKHIIGMKKDESDALLNFLYAHAPKAEFQLHFRCIENAIAMCNTRCAQHLAVRHYYPEVRSDTCVIVNGD